LKNIVKILHGSHLYGTNTPNSDTDYKYVIMPDVDKILLQKAKRAERETTGKPHEKNTKDDIDEGRFSLGGYFELLEQGQTMALDLLFAPPSHRLETSPLWEHIVSNRSKLVHKNMTAFVGYCQTQAAKYGIKGSRMAAVKTASDVLSQLDPESRMYEHWSTLNSALAGVDHIAFIQVEVNKIEKTLVDHLEVCNRKFDRACKVGYVLDALQKIYDNYGERAKLAMKNEGIDWKALSHAVRVCVQGLELLETGHMTLPLPEPQLSLVRDIKLGQLPYSEVQDIIEGYVSRIDEASNKSSLPEHLDSKFCRELTMRAYATHVMAHLKTDLTLPCDVTCWLERT